ncbi:hypothetical protein [Actinomadura rayongensis]|uniref:Uncharacterized protein n=1 Tax=Actinomadura rayongensis TaxID=1429076 RepID=A0A6I4WGP5_9ACTN|nr:hypothetical protein [Actinomadura rayongensis]MXQ65782.1 hypothetical protein [Actinomadura rayongensis]
MRPRPRRADSAGAPRPRSRRRRAALALTAGAALLASSLTALPSARAIQPADLPAVGVDTGRFKLPIACTINFAGALPVLWLPLDVDIQGVAPVQLGPGQEFWLTQGSGSITFPEWLTALAPILGIDKADATISDMSIGATHSTPDAVNLAKDPISIKDIPIVAGKPLKVGLPAAGQKAFDVGPYTAPQSGKVTLGFNSAFAKVDLKSSWGFSLPITADCKPRGGNALLTIAVGGASGQAPAKIQGAPLNFGEPKSGELTGIINAPYQCVWNGQTYGAGIAVGADGIPLTVSKSGSFSFTNASGALTVPKETVNKLLDQGVTTISGKVTNLTLDVEGGTPQSLNVIPSAGIDIPKTTLTRDQQIVVPLPQDGTLTAGPFKPTSGASSVQVSLGGATASLSFDGGAATTATCGKPSPTVYLVDNPVT